MFSAAYAHLVLTHVPLIGTLAGTVLLGLGLAFNNSPVSRAGFLALVASALVAIPTFLTGSAAEHAVELLPGVVEERVEHHEEVAIFGLVASLAVGVIALGSLIAFRRRPVPRALLLGLILLSLVPFGALAWTANSGGKIRHPEILSPEEAAQPAGAAGEVGEAR
jgi:predicted Na+-dependent transporter